MRGPHAIAAVAFIWTVSCSTGPGVGVATAPAPAALTTPAATGIAAATPGFSTARPVDGHVDAGSRCASVLNDLIKAFNVGDRVELERIVGGGPLRTQAFQWVSFHDAVGRDTEYTVEAARSLLLDRWSRGQRLTLVSFNVAPGPSWHGGADLSVRLDSRSPVVSGSAPLHGKMALDCAASRVYVLSLGAD